MEELRHMAHDKESQGVFYCKYNSNGHLLKYYILDTPVSIQYGKYCDIRSDLLESKEVLKRLNYFLDENSDPDKDILRKALFDYCLSLVVRCFNSSDGRKTRLDSKSIFENNTGLKDSFDKILEIRNSQIAHAGKSAYTVTLYFENGIKQPVDIDACNLRRNQGDSTIRFEDISNMLEYLIERIDKKREKLLEKIADELKSKGGEYYYENAKEVDVSSIITVKSRGNVFVFKKD
jgi:hypothetical protein